MEKAIHAEFQLFDPQTDIAGDIHRTFQAFVAAGLLEPIAKRVKSAQMPKP